MGANIKWHALQGNIHRNLFSRENDWNSLVLFFILRNSKKCHISVKLPLSNKALWFWPVFIVCHDDFSSFFSTLAPPRNTRQKIKLIDTLDVHFRLASSKLNWMLWKKKIYIAVGGGQRHRSRKTEFNTDIGIWWKIRIRNDGSTFVSNRKCIACWSITYQSIMQSYSCKFSS